MGFFSQIKEKFVGKSAKQNEKYVAGLDRSNSTFSDRINELAARFREINDEYFEELENILIMSSGDVVEISEDSCRVAEHVQASGILVDGLGVGDVGNIVLRDRQNLAQNGIIIVVLTLEKYSNQLLAGPDIVSRGFVYVRESEDLMDDARQVVDDAVADCLDRHVSDWGKMKNVIRDSLSDFMWKRMKRNPMILPIIMEVE